MYPELFKIGDFAVSSFGLLLLAAFVCAYFQLRSGMRSLGIGDEEDASAILFAAGVAGIAGSKIYYAILYSDWRLVFSRYGLVWYGGFLLATLAVVAMIRWRRLPLLATIDAASVGLALGYGVGRIGCFLVGDDWGRPTDLPWGVAFPQGAPPTTAYQLRELGLEVPEHLPADAVLAVHPTQLYETGAALVIWLLGRWALKQGWRPGRVFALMVGSLAVERFLVELVRAKDDRFFGDFTLAQLISVAVVLAAGYLWLRLGRRQSAAAG